MFDMIKIAYIVQCHKNSNQLNLLLKTLLDENVDVFLHIDKKWVDAEKDILKDPHIFIIPENESIDVQWGDISQVQATLLLMEHVLRTKKEYDYIWFISGQDFPVKSKKYIYEFLSLNKTRAFINIANIPYATKRNEIFYPNCLKKRNFFSKLFKYIWVKISGGRNHTFKIFKRKECKNFNFYFGSCWWCLPMACVAELHEMISQDENYLNFFSGALCPDESFFQTLIMKSSYKDKISNYLVYVDWSEGNASPRILTEQDFEYLTNQNEYLFARKFDINIDSKILEKLTEYLKGNIIK